MAKPASVSLVPKVLNVELYAGDGAVLRLTVGGGSVPVTGEVKAQIKKDRQSEPITEWATDLTQGQQGIVLISLTGEQTAALINGTGAPFSGVWDCQWTPTDAEPKTLIQGAVKVVADVTH